MITVAVLIVDIGYLDWQLHPHTPLPHPVTVGCSFPVPRHGYPGPHLAQLPRLIGLPTWEDSQNHGEPIPDGRTAELVLPGGIGTHYRKKAYIPLPSDTSDLTCPPHTHTTPPLRLVTPRFWLRPE